MERCRQGDAILPLVGAQQSVCYQAIYLTLPQLHPDARETTLAPLAVTAHALGARGKRCRAIVQGDVLRLFGSQLSAWSQTWCSPSAQSMTVLEIRQSGRTEEN